MTEDGKIVVTEENMSANGVTEFDPGSIRTTRPALRRRSKRCTSRWLPSALLLGRQTFESFPWLLAAARPTTGRKSPPTNGVPGYVLSPTLTDLMGELHGAHRCWWTRSAPEGHRERPGSRH